MTEQPNPQDKALDQLLYQIHSESNDALGYVTKIQSALMDTKLVDTDPESLLQMATHHVELEADVANVRNGSLRDRVANVNQLMAQFEKLTTLATSLKPETASANKAVTSFVRNIQTVQQQVNRKMALLRTVIPDEPKHFEKTLSTSVGVSPEIESEKSNDSSGIQAAGVGMAKVFPDPMEEASALEHISQVVGALEAEIALERHEPGIVRMLDGYAIPRLELAIELIRTPIETAEVAITHSTLMERIASLNLFLTAFVHLKDAGAELVAAITEHWEPIMEAVGALVL